jgi:hypothetical protein
MTKFVGYAIAAIVIISSMMVHPLAAALLALVLLHAYFVDGKKMRKRRAEEEERERERKEHSRYVLANLDQCYAEHVESCQRHSLTPRPRQEWEERTLRELGFMRGPFPR